MLKVTEAIVQFTVSEKSKENAWRDLVNEVKMTHPSNVLEQFVNAETEFMEQYHSTNPDAKTKKGRWKTSKYLPNAYKSAKSVITRALASGQELTDTNGNPRGKSEVERSIPKSPKLVLVTELIDKHVDALAKYQHAGFDEDVRNSLRKIVNIEE